MCDLNIWDGCKLYITSLTMSEKLIIFPSVFSWCHLAKQPWQLKHALTRLKRAPFLDISRLKWEAVKRNPLCDRCTHSAAANVTFPWASNIQRLSGPASLCSVIRFLFLGQPERADKMDANVTALAEVTDGLIIQTHPSGHRKTQHLAC